MSLHENWKVEMKQRPRSYAIGHILMTSKVEKTWRSSVVVLRYPNSSLLVVKGQVGGNEAAS